MLSHRRSKPPPPGAADFALGPLLHLDVTSQHPRGVYNVSFSYVLFILLYRQWVYDYVTSEELVMWRIKAKIDKLAQNRSPASLDEAIQQGDFDALLCRYPVEVSRLIRINEASNDVIGSGYSYDYDDFKSYFNSGVFHEMWSERFRDWITLIELQQAEGWTGYQRTFHFTGGFALLEEIEHVLRDNLAIWKVWDCRALIESLMARKGALFHFYNTVRKRPDYNHKKFDYDPDHTIQSKHAPSAS
ncbi:hypothetical protein PISL3812_08133 [Talaromyces islandicus]|uniref:Uncharacterized protein n=1 Tax=Talaromyces islandicus TaxID=28573 RepID=A0A0U1M672_TALIS|nr:hypothetical protein PISL3812_08133 [Talaromyces islandicus]